MRVVQSTLEIPFTCLPHELHLRMTCKRDSMRLSMTYPACPRMVPVCNLNTQSYHGCDTCFIEHQSRDDQQGGNMTICDSRNQIAMYPDRRLWRVL